MKLKSVTKLLRNKLLLVTTIIPTALAILYFGLIASDVYISESRFVVRSQGKPMASALGMLLSSSGFAKAQDDSYIVQDYILSRDAELALENELAIIDSYSKPEIDVFSRFAVFGINDSKESFHRYFQNKLSIQIDSSSSISALSVRAFSAKNAQQINQRLVELAELLVNKLNERGKEDSLQFAMAEVVSAQEKAKSTALALAAYRNEKGVIDPEKQSAVPLQQIAKIQEELLATRMQIVQLEKLAGSNPQLPPLRQRATSLEQAIKEEGRRITGGGKSLAGKAAEFHRLVLEKEFADKMLASAMATLEQARNEVQKKQLYLERIVQPNLPDEATEPKRLRNILVTFSVAMILWGILTLLLAGVREHNE